MDKVCMKDYEILERVLRVIITLAVKTVVNIHGETSLVEDPQFRKRVIAAMLTSQTKQPNTASMGLIPLIFMEQTELTREEFVKVLCCNDCSWILNPVTIRRRM